MPYMYSGMQNKLSKTRESPLESMEKIISSRCPVLLGLCGIRSKTPKTRYHNEAHLSLSQSDAVQIHNSIEIG